MTPLQKPSLWKFGGLKLAALGKQVWNNFGEDELSVRSAALAYYFVLAVFPAMLFLLSLLGFFAATGTHLRESLFAAMAQVLPGSASELVQQTINEVTRAKGAGKAVFGILGALWSASAGVAAIIESLNIAYQMKETRPFWKRKVLALGLTLALAALVLTASALALNGNGAANALGAHLSLGASLVTIWKVLRWPVVLVFMFVAFATTYYFAPNVAKPEWNWVTPGSAFGLILWLASSFAFKIYLHYFDSYSKTYGSVGAVIILLLWLYITGLSIMLGGIVNSVITRATEEQETKRTQQESTEMLRAA
jgi:membrane protein